MIEPVHFLYLGGFLHFAILLASATAPRALNWSGHLAGLPLLLRQMFWVYGAFIVLIIVSFGTLSLAQADALVSGASLSRWICGMITIFWTARLGVQFFVFDAEPWLTRRLYRIGYHLLTGVFVTLVVIYSWFAIS